MSCAMDIGETGLRESRIKHAGMKNALAMK